MAGPTYPWQPFFGEIAACTYAPTIADTEGVNFIAVTPFFWQRLGRIVTVSGLIEAQIPFAGGNIDITITVPFGTAPDLSGSLINGGQNGDGQNPAAPGTGTGIFGDDGAGNLTARVRLTLSGLGIQTSDIFAAQFSYEVV